jgi:hypothetical protein
MSHHFCMGAINKLTNQYEYPLIAKKGNKYICPECKRDVNFCKGKIKQPYFAHKRSESPCYYYDRPNESQIHKDAKQLLHKLLTNKTPMNFYNICEECDDKMYGCCELNENCYETTEPIIEYKFEYSNSNKSADVALVKENSIIYIFEICYKNKTRENARPEPWVEINAEDFIRNINNSSLLDENGILHVRCMRDKICNKCNEAIEQERKDLEEWYRQCEIKKQKHIKELKRQEIERKQKEDERMRREALNQKEELEKRKNEINRLKEAERKKYLQTYNNFKSQVSMTCSVCNISYCKCDSTKAVKNIYGIECCVSCNNRKQKCKCVKITDYFKMV